MDAVKGAFPCCAVLETDELLPLGWFLTQDSAQAVQQANPQIMGIAATLIAYSLVCSSGLVAHAQAGAWEEPAQIGLRRSSLPARGC